MQTWLFITYTDRTFLKGHLCHKTAVINHTYVHAEFPTKSLFYYKQLSLSPHADQESIKKQYYSNSRNVIHTYIVR